MNGKLRFYYYTVSAYTKYNKKEKVDLSKLITIEKLKKSSILIKRDIGNYRLSFEFYNDFFFGVIYRSKEDDEFFHISKKKRWNVVPNVLSKLLGEKGETGEIRRDMVYFAFCFKDGDMLVLIQQGFQTPEMGVFRDFFEELLKEHELTFTHQCLKTKKVVNSLKKIFNKQLKIIRITPKRNVDLPTNWPIESFLKDMESPRDIEIQIQMKIKTKRGKKEGLPSVGEFLPKFFGASEEDIDVLLQTDFVKFFSDFMIVARDERNEFKEDILSKLEKEEIFIKRKFFDESRIRQLAEELGEKLKNKINEIKNVKGE